MTDMKAAIAAFRDGCEGTVGLTDAEIGAGLDRAAPHLVPRGGAVDAGLRERMAEDAYDAFCRGSDDASGNDLWGPVVDAVLALAGRTEALAPFADQPGLALVHADDFDGTCECGSDTKENCEASPNGDCGVIKSKPPATLERLARGVAEQAKLWAFGKEIRAFMLAFAKHQRDETARRERRRAAWKAVENAMTEWRESLSAMPAQQPTRENGYSATRALAALAKEMQG